MKLWLISQNETRGSDTFDSAVVAAETAEDAKQIHPMGDDSWNSSYRLSLWCSSPEKVSVEFIGEAATGIGKGVILSSFNAG